MEFESGVVDSILALEPDETAALGIEITGVDGNAYTYAVTMIPSGTAGPSDVEFRVGGLEVVVAADSVSRLRGSIVRASDGGFIIDNPNTPSPSMHDPAATPLDLDLPVETRVRRAIDDQINPAIASHGGRVDLIGVEGSEVMMRMSGGCQGCTLAGVTLAEGIELLIKKAAPEIDRVVDITDHASGEDPYFIG